MSHSKAALRIERIAKAREHLNREREWVQEHGENIAGYVARYGDSDAPHAERYGDGGQLIYEADIKALRAAEQRLADAQA